MYEEEEEEAGVDEGSSDVSTCDAFLASSVATCVVHHMR